MRISRRSTFHTLAFCLEENWVSLEMIRKVIDSILKMIRERSELFQKLSRLKCVDRYLGRAGQLKSQLLLQNVNKALKKAGN